jgi:hypothetical protein
LLCELEKTIFGVADAIYLFTVYLATLDTSIVSDDWMVLNTELSVLWKEIVGAIAWRRSGRPMKTLGHDRHDS